MTGWQILVLAGLPGAGKTTEAQRLRQQDPYTVIVARDALRAMLFGEQPTTDQVEASLTVLLRHLAVYAARLHYRVIVDDLTLDEPTRAMWRAVAEQTGLTVRILEFLTPLETCIERDAQRSQPVGAETIKAFAAESGR
jgi:predicted kinase